MLFSGAILIKLMNSKPKLTLYQGQSARRYKATLSITLFSQNFLDGLQPKPKGFLSSPLLSGRQAALRQGVLKSLDGHIAVLSLHGLSRCESLRLHLPLPMSSPETPLLHDPQVIAWPAGWL
ncbi:MAG: hypothetical protein LH480_07660 [Rubrivivax sp.]|nr:hypothetical protein [Rubrivivax sp.]